MSAGSFNLVNTQDAVQEGGAHAPPSRGSLKPSFWRPPGTYQVRNTVGTRQRRGALGPGPPSPTCSPVGNSSFLPSSFVDFRIGRAYTLANLAATCRAFPRAC